MIPAVVFATFLLVVGCVLRIRLRLLQWIVIPASIVGGLVGLVFVQFAALGEHEVVATWKSWPGTLIAVVFACMFLERGSKSPRESLRLAGREGLVVWIIVLGQTAAGLLCTWLIIQPFVTDVPNSFAMLIETGFAGGHGTAAAMGTVFESEGIQLANGRDLGLFMATIGLLFSVVSGVVYVNIALRAGWIGQIKSLDFASSWESREERPAISKGVVRPEVIDPFVFQILFVGAAFGIGWIAKETVTWVTTPAVRSERVVLAPVPGEDNSPVAEFQSAESVAEDAGATNDSREATTSDGAIEARDGQNAELEVDAGLTASQALNVEEEASAEQGSPVAASNVLRSRASLSGTIGDFPLFIYTLFGGLAVRRLLTVFGHQDLIDALSIQRISAIAMEFLIVAAIASLRIEAVKDVAAPLMILLAVAFVWTGFCLLYVGRKLLPKDYWFQLGILNYGMSTGTTATGFTLLKIVDKDLDSGAAEDYALAAPLSAPFVGGGMLTVGLPLLVLEGIPIAVSASVISAIVVGLFALGLYLRSDDV